jgi:hypothetical protein
MAKRRQRRPRPIPAHWLYRPAGPSARAVLARNVRWGVTGGLEIAAVYCAWVLVVYALRGPRPFERQGVTLTTVLAFYVGAGAAAGALVGLLRPLAPRGEGSAYAVGLLAGVPVAIGAALCTRGLPSGWDATEVVVAAVMTVLVGLFIGRELAKHAAATRAAETAAGASAAD